MQLQSQHRVTTFLNYSLIRVKFITLPTRTTPRVLGVLSCEFLEAWGRARHSVEKYLIMSADAFLYQSLQVYKWLTYIRSSVLMLYCTILPLRFIVFCKFRILCVLSVIHQIFFSRHFFLGLWKEHFFVWKGYLGHALLRCNEAGNNPIHTDKVILDSLHGPSYYNKNNSNDTFCSFNWTELVHQSINSDDYHCVISLQFAPAFSKAGSISPHLMHSICWTD